MQGRRRYSVTKRLFAATLSFALMLASIVSAHAHAAHENCRHDHAIHVAPDEVHHAAVDAHDHHGNESPDVIAKHTSCGDLLCHGGVAILTGQIDNQHLHERSVVMIPRNEMRIGSGQSSLDRPPRVPALV